MYSCKISFMYFDMCRCNFAHYIRAIKQPPPLAWNKICCNTEPLWRKSMAFVCLSKTSIHTSHITLQLEGTLGYWKENCFSRQLNALITFPCPFLFSVLGQFSYIMSLNYLKVPRLLKNEHIMHTRMCVGTLGVLKMTLKIHDPNQTEVHVSHYISVTE